MAVPLPTIMTSSPPVTTKVLVDYYDETHRGLLADSPIAAKLGQGPVSLEVSTVDFLTYYLFYKKTPGSLGFQTFREIRERYWQALVELDGQVRLAEGSLLVQREVLEEASFDPISSATVERIGEGVGLAVVSELHQLIEADWARIKSSSKSKTLDFEFAASDGETLIKVETKGSVAADNSKKSSSISKEKAHIAAKKRVERASQSTGSRDRCSFLYGTIAVISPSAGAVCWLLDPPLNLESPPARFRLIARMRAIGDLIRFVAGRSHLSVAVQTRLAALEQLDDVEALNRVPLRRGDGQDMFIDAFDPFTRRHGAWLTGRSRVVDGPAGGHVVQPDERALLFIGMREELTQLMTAQDFSTIRTYRFRSGTEYKTVLCVVSESRFDDEFKLPDAVETRRSGGHVMFRLSGYLHYSSGGVVFGVLPVQHG